ncbi:unnamed protein product [Prunus armeniaca]|uniref:FAS1 domain-containing protein n=1 Tax=Prunus armeniaca TaxID=36596 RepID=A0A6J5W2U2_PRUAR|nr:unnamed protein product [Prunus armeniaca]
MAAAQLLLSLVVLSVLSLSSALPTQTLVNAAEILSDFGYTSMALTLDLASQTLLLSQSPSLTIFASTDAAFSHSGQPPLNLLQFHIIPLYFSLRSLKSLPFGAKISTLLSDHSLSVTTLAYDPRVSLNNVPITVSPIFDDGSLIIFGIDRFLDPHFRILGPLRSYTPKNLGCLAPKNPNEAMEVRDAYYPFSEASNALRSKGCSVMASFLEMQFHGFFFKYQTMMTVFAPFDQVLMNRVGNLSEQSSIFHRHVVPCRLLWSDLVSFNDGTVLRTNLMGFTINITRSQDVLMVNGVSVIFPEVYHNGWLSVHGISEVLEVPHRTEQAEQTEQVTVAPSEFGNSYPEEESTISHSHFFVVRPT